jgi:hypothetical protein
MWQEWPLEFLTAFGALRKSFASRLTAMEKSSDRIDKVLVFIFILVYVGAKLHFFTRYGELGLGAYLEEHAWFWAGMAIVALIGAYSLRRRLARPNSN